VTIRFRYKETFFSDEKFSICRVELTTHSTRRTNGNKAPFGEFPIFPRIAQEAGHWVFPVFSLSFVIDLRIVSLLGAIGV
jgi:hypothetical protein